MNTSVNALDSNGNSILHWAVKGNHTDIVRYLIQTQNASVNVKNNAGTSVLHWAVYKGSKELLNLLLDAGIDKDSQV